jgi:predicted nucleotidyltransferase
MSEARAKPQRQRPTPDDILRTLRVRLPELQERYGVRTLGMFGSYVRGEQRPQSDVDLLVEFDERPLTLIQVIALEQYLSDLLGVKVDLVEKKTLKPAIGRHILQEVVPV